MDIGRQVMDGTHARTQTHKHTPHSPHIHTQVKLSQAKKQPYVIVFVGVNGVGMQKSQ